jgi:acetyl esterase
MLDSDAKLLLDLIASRNLPSYHTLPVDEARTLYRERRFFAQPEPPEVALAQDLKIPGPVSNIPLRHYRPQGWEDGKPLPALVYYHGGGHTIGDLDTHDTLCRELANLSGWAVFSVDYRLGPEHRFPAAVDDSFAALQWIAANAEQLAILPQRLAVGGDSAGGNLAAVAALLARDAGEPALAFQLLIYPVTDFRFATASHRANAQGYLLTREVIDYFTDCYLADRSQATDWRVSPALAADHTRLPPALVLTAGYDPLHDEGVDYARLLQQAGNQVEHVDYPGQIHGFVPMGKAIRQANDAVALCARRLRSLGGGE